MHAPDKTALAEQPRARGTVSIDVKAKGAGTGLRNLRQSGSFRAVFPRTPQVGVEAVLVNTAGGVTGGDRFRVDATAEAGCTLTLTTQAAERAYRAQPEEVGQIRNSLVVQGDGRVNWLPQETILFDACALDRCLTVQMDADATLLMVEPLVFGRAAMGESLKSCNFTDRIRIDRNGVPLFRDAFRFGHDVTAQLARAGTLNGAGAMAQLVYVAPDAEGYLAKVRAGLPDTAGASLIGHDLLVVRALAADSFALRQCLVPVLNLLNHSSLPRSWML